MLKREHIKQAIEAIAAREPEIGYALDETLGMGRITVPRNPAEAVDGDDLFFWFEDQRATVKKFIYFNAGTVGIEERLLLKYGELTRRQQLLDQGGRLDFIVAAAEIRRAGLKFMVLHELDFAIQRLTRRMEKHGAENASSKPDADHGLAVYRDRLERLQWIRNTDPDEKTGPEKPQPQFCFTGTVNAGTPAGFMPFPFTLDALMQVADINLEFFHVRFLLDCLLHGVDDTLFVCLVEGRIVGLIQVAFKRQLFYQGLEIKYVATLRGSRTESEHPPVRGAGTFLVAGVWLLWQGGRFNAREMLLDSESGARGFYEAIGFQTRGPSEFVLKHPQGPLVRAIAAMVCRSPIHPKAISAVAQMMKRQVRLLARKLKRRQQTKTRHAVLDAIDQLLQSDRYPELSRTLVSELAKNRRKIPEAADLLLCGALKNNQEG